MVLDRNLSAAESGPASPTRCGGRERVTHIVYRAWCAVRNYPRVQSLRVFTDQSSARIRSTAHRSTVGLVPASELAREGCA